MATNLPHPDRNMHHPKTTAVQGSNELIWVRFLTQACNQSALIGLHSKIGIIDNSNQILCAKLYN
jgi:hypothetical protein